MKAISPVLLGLSLAVVGSSLAAAQEMASGPPKVLEVQREFLKPGKAGMIHDKSESNFVQAFQKAKWPTHYFAMNSMSGKSRALYFTGYDSFAAWEKDNKAMEANAAISAAIDRTEMSDGELQSEFDQFVFYYDEDMSYRPDMNDIAHCRYMEISSYQLKPDSEKQWTEIVKMVMDATKKAGTSAHWAMYEIAYGGADEYVILSPDKSLSEIDTGYMEGKKFEAAMGEEGMRKLHELIQATVVSADSELFEFNPRQSYPDDDWIKADPDFWKPKAAMAPAKSAPAATKPAQ